MRIEHSPELGEYTVMDWGTYYEADFFGMDAPPTMRLCTPCYENEGRLRLGNKGDPWMGEEVLCMVHWRRREAEVSDAAFNAPITESRGRPRTQGGPCKVHGCPQPSRSTGLCNKHYTAEIRRQSKESQ